MTRRLYFAELGPTLRRDGWAVLPARGKRLLLEDWSSLDITPERVAAWAANRRDACRCKLCGGEEPIEGHAADNLSIRTGAQCLPGLFVSGLDIDLYDAEVAKVVRASARSALGHGPLRVGQAPKALLVYRTTEAVRKITSPTWVSPDGKEHRVEFLGAGQQFVAAGIHPDTGQEYRWFDGSPLDTEPAFFPSVTPEAVSRWFNETLPGLIPSDWTLKKAGSTSSTPWEADPFDAVKGTHDDVDLDRAKHLLDLLPEELCDDHDSWVLVGQALHHQFGGSDEALELWDEWSARSEKWVGGVCKGRWKTFSEQRDGGIVTIGTLKHLASPYLKEEAREAAKGYREQIAEAPDRKTLEDKIVPVIRADQDLSPIDREVVIQALQKRLTALTGERIPLATVRKLVRPERVIALAEAGPPPDDALFLGPEWAKEWVWVSSEDKFMHRRVKELVSITSFDMRYGWDEANLSEVGPDGVLVRYSPSERMRRHWRVPVVFRKMYWPAAGPVFEWEGISYANAWRPELRVRPDAAWTPEGLKTVEAVKRHLRVIIPNRRERRLLVAWLAHNYKHPGKKIRWAVLLKGAEGDGKSILGELLQILLGGANVRMMNADTVRTSPFSGWVAGQCVTVFEEVKFQGHNRYDVVNRIKPYISNNVVEYHPKGKDPGQIFNCTNYLMFTNHEDALPLAIGDRRYFVIHTPFATKEELSAWLEAIFGFDRNAHFDEIFGLVRNNAGQLAKWLDGYEMPAEFNADGEAPNTEAKGLMVQAARGDDDALAGAILRDGAEGVSKAVVATSYFSAAVEAACGSKPYSSKIAGYLSAAGYRPMQGNGSGAGVLKWKGKACRIWVSKDFPDVTNDWVRAELDKTVAEATTELFEDA